VESLTDYFTRSVQDNGSDLGIYSLGWALQGKLKRASHRFLIA
jgi:hypothetical protein